MNPSYDMFVADDESYSQAYKLMQVFVAFRAIMSQMDSNTLYCLYNFMSIENCTSNIFNSKTYFSVPA